MQRRHGRHGPPACRELPPTSTLAHDATLHVEQRIRLAYHVASMLAEFDSPAVIQAWLIGLNPELDDAVPIELLRRGDIQHDGKKVLNAERAFVAGG